MTAGACGGCSQHRTDSLIRLGLNPDKWDLLVALAGNPNVGKSTVFNAMGVTVCFLVTQVWRLLT